jgi:peroxiredoxin Q/BCP
MVRKLDQTPVENNTMRMLTLLALTAGLVMGGRGFAEELKVGDAAPTFEAKDDAGKTFKSADVIGKKIVVVYFYPADFTGGCTAQACAFRDDYDKLAKKGVEVIGVSGDSVKTHELFKKKKELPFTLLSDETGELAKKFGVPVQVGAKTAKVKIDDKDVSLERGATISRWTFVIGKDGKIASVDKKVAAKDDSKKVAETVEKLEK